MNSIETLLSKLVGLRSYFPHEHEPLDFLIPFLAESGFNVKKQIVEKDRYNLLAERGRGKISILFYMHLDTVPPPKSLATDPLVLKKKGGNFYGLGSFDMKGGIAVILSIINSQEFKNHKIKIAFCIDEEQFSKGAYRLTNSDFLKDVDIAFCPEACIISKDWKLPIMIVLGGRGRCVIEITIPGKTAHGAGEETGINAIDQATILVGKLKSLKLKQDIHMGKSSFFVRSFNSTGGDVLSIPDTVSIELDYQMVVGENPEEIRNKVNLFIKDLYELDILEKSLKNNFSVKLKERETPYISPYAVSRNNKYVKLVEKVSKSQFGNASFDYTKSVADQNILVNAGIPTITIGPIGGNPHESGEWVSLKSLYKLSEFYKKLISEIDRRNGD